jgi:hypothetical protein
MFKLKILSNEIWQKLKKEDDGFRFGSKVYVKMRLI